jgi:5-methylcytosine-specific restriction endonuclease McrA
MGALVMKQCSKCKEIKPKSEFNKDSKSKDGLRPYCKVCVAVYNRERAERLKLKNADRTEFPETKRCPTCGETKAGSEFSRNNSSSADGLRSRCKSCNAEYDAATKLHRAVRNGYRKAVALGNHAEEFDGDDLEAHWLANGISAEHCNYCGVQLSTLEAKDQQLDHVHALNAGGPHVMDNIVPCCGSCNQSKKDKPLERFQTATS